MTSSYLPNYIPNDAFQIRSHSRVLGVRTSMCVFWGKMSFNPSSHLTSLCLSFLPADWGQKYLPRSGLMRNKQEDIFNLPRIVFDT